jgi:hypothetical protein
MVMDGRQIPEAYVLVGRPLDPPRTRHPPAVGINQAYRLTSNGTKVALLFILFHKRVCGPLASSLFQRRPDPQAQPHSRIEAAYHRADQAIEKVLQLLAA